MRKRIIAGNWKMNTTVQEAVELAKAIVSHTAEMGDADAIVCTPFTHLVSVAEVIKDSPVKLGAQDLYWEKSGAFTGQISADMLKSVGCDYVIIGHSERRQFFGETDETVNKKTKAALQAGLTPIVCVGELLHERESNQTQNVVETQIRGAFEGLLKEDAGKLVLAYEPVWAIGTGKVATPAQAQEVHAFIRNLVKTIFDNDVAENIQIQYGGSMKPDNAAELLGNPDVDGGLIGGASLKADSFFGIINA